MQIDFPYPGYEQIAPAEVPDDHLMGIFSPRAYDNVDQQQAIRDGFANPIGAPPLRDAVRGKQRVLVLIDDGTRMTPTATILPHFMDELHAGGVEDEGIEFLQAPGTHRPMKEEELKHKLGPYFGRHKVHEHHYLDRNSLHDFGKTPDGTPVTANKLLTEFDFVTGIGSIVPHRVKGVSGGAKLAFPGVSGREMMDRNQWEASMHMSETVMGTSENAMRHRMEAAARLAGFTYIVNAVYDIKQRVVGLFVGDVVEAHRQGALRSREVYAAHMPTRADIVLIDSHSADRDFWQSAKGPYAGTIAVKDGGTLILVSPNPEGVASNHPILMKIGYKPHAEIVAMVQRGEVDDLVGVGILADVAQIVDKTDCIMVSPGVKPDEARQIGFRHADTASEAIQMALQKQGKDATIAILRYGGHILPIVDDETADLDRDRT